MPDPCPCPPIGDYAFLGNGHTAALISGDGSVDWCCMPRVDAASCFGRLLDREKGGFCSLSPTDPGATTERGYVDDTLVLETRVKADGGAARVFDCLTMDDDERWELLRVVEGTQGGVELELRIVPRLDYGALAPWLRRHGPRVCSATGGDDALVITGDLELEPAEHEIEARFTVHAGDRVRLSIGYAAPDALDRDPPSAISSEELDRRLDATVERWRACAGQVSSDASRREIVRSALVLKALANPRTGAIAAAATTSLPEAPGGELNWDYRYSWIRDSAFSVRSLTEAGFRGEADAFRRFVERSAAGGVDGLQIMYGMGGERRLGEMTLDALEGYRGAQPVRVGNAASGQRQLDVYGHLLALAWRWHERGHAPDDDYWRFLAEVVNAAARRWREPDRGIWEVRGDPRHFVHSKAMCWAALHHGIRLAEECGREAPLERWRAERDAVREAIEEHGYHSDRETFVQTFGDDRLDAALLLLPEIGLVAWDDPRMVRTVDAIRDELDDDGLLLRYRVRSETEDGPQEGAFVACTFWLAECLTRQGRGDEAKAAFNRASGCANDLGLYSEEYAPQDEELLGNFPQALTHLAHISAALALEESAS